LVNLLRLHLNESPYRLPEDRLERVLAGAAATLNRYPERAVDLLRERYAAYAGASAQRAAQVGPSPGQVVPTNGGDEAINLTVITLRPLVRQVVVLTPTFPEYSRAARLAGLDVVEVPLAGQDYHIDLDGLSEALRRAPSLVFVCSPNNPTGNLLDTLEALDVIAAAPGPAWVAVDEAYWEFAGETVLAELDRRENLVVIRTMSKAFCLAGARLGFALAAPALSRQLETARMLFNVDALTAAVGAAALDDPAYVRDVVAAVAEARERLAAGLGGLPGIVPYPSRANFVFVRTQRPGPDLARALALRGILVRAYPDVPDLLHRLRVTVGAPEEVDRSLSAFADALGVPG